MGVLCADHVRFHSRRPYIARASTDALIVLQASARDVPEWMKYSSYRLTKIMKSRMSGFSRGELEAGRNELGLCTARYEYRSCC